MPLSGDSHVPEGAKSVVIRSAPLPMLLQWWLRKPSSQRRWRVGHSEGCQGTVLSLNSPADPHPLLWSLFLSSECIRQAQLSHGAVHLSVYLSTVSPTTLRPSLASIIKHPFVHPLNLPVSQMVGFNMSTHLRTPQSLTNEEDPQEAAGYSSPSFSKTDLHKLELSNEIPLL